MNFRVIILPFVLTMLGSCRQEKAAEVTADDTASVAPVVQPAPIEPSDVKHAAYSSGQPGDSATFHFVNTEIGADPFRNDFETILREVGDYEVKKELLKNPHTANQIDTVFQIIFEGSTITYFKGKTDAFIVSAKIRSGKVAFKQGIRVGMSKSDFFKLFEELRARNEDQVKASDVDGLQSVTFLFTDGVLAEVDFEGYFD